MEQVEILEEGESQVFSRTMALGEGGEKEGKRERRAGGGEAERERQGGERGWEERWRRRKEEETD